MVIAIVGFIVIAVIAAVAYSAWQEDKSRKNGKEVEAIVIKNEAECKGSGRRNIFVKYKSIDDENHIALLDVNNDIPVGKKLRVKYVPYDYSSVVFISQES